MTAPVLDRPSTSRQAGTAPAAPRGRRQRRDLRGVVGLAVLLALLAAVVGRLVQVQVLDAGPYAAAASDQRLRTVPLPAVRGAVLDRHGTPLARDVEGRRVVADPSLVDDPGAVARVLVPVLDQPAAIVAERLGQDTRFVLLADDLSVELGEEVSALEQPGVFVQDDQVRDRPDGTLAASVVGFTGADDVGLAGVEARLQDVLAGTAGEERYEVDGDGRRIPQGVSRERPSRPGRDVVLTLDRDLQYRAEAALDRQIEETGASSGSVVVLDPATGDVLALATGPTFDADDWRGASADERRNPAVSDVNEPGSVQKVVTAAAALDAGVVTPEEVLDLPKTLGIGPVTVRDEHPLVGPHTFAEVIAASSNVGTVTVAERLGRGPLHDAMVRFGYGERTGVGLPGESPGVLPAPETRYRAGDATVPIGYGMSVTALQVAQVFSTVANDGLRVPPRVVLGERGADGRVAAARRPEPVRAISAQAADALTGVLQGVVSAEGTAPLAAVPGYEVAGKTGTARRLDPESGTYSRSDFTSSFAGFAPADDPALVVSVTLVEPRGAYFGGVVAAPVFAEVMGYGLQRAGVPPEVGQGTVPADAGDGSTRDGGVPSTPGVLPAG